MVEFDKTLENKILNNRILKTRILKNGVLGNSSIDRQIRWNRTTGSNYDQGDLMTKMYFLLINQPREISKIQDKIYNFYQSVVDAQDLFEDAIPNSEGLHYLCLSFETPNGIWRPNDKIYSGKKADNFKIYYDPELKLKEAQGDKALFYLQKYVDEKVCKINRSE